MCGKIRLPSRSTGLYNSVSQCKERPHWSLRVTIRGVVPPPCQQTSCVQAYGWLTDHDTRLMITQNDATQSWVHLLIHSNTRYGSLGRRAYPSVFYTFTVSFWTKTAKLCPQFSFFLFFLSVGEGGGGIDSPALYSWLCFVCDMVMDVCCNHCQQTVPYFLFHIKLCCNYSETTKISLRIGLAMFV